MQGMLRFVPLVLLALASGASAQRLTKGDEEARFHQNRVKQWTSGKDRLAAWDLRKQRMADSPFGNLRWRNIGPTQQGGRVIQIRAPRNHPDQVIVAFATGGLWRTSDDGITWTPLFDYESAYAIGDFDVTADGKTLWVGTGENNSQRTSYSGTGVFRSDDSGKTWRHMGLEDTHRIGRILIHPRNPNTVYVGAIGALYSPNPERGVYKTTDGGKSWSHVLKLDAITGVIDMVMDPTNPEVIYASAWDRERRSWNIKEGGKGTAIYKTSNGGKTWSKLAGGLPDNGELGRIGLAISPSRPQTVYAFVDNQGPDAQDFAHDERIPSGQLTLKRFRQLDEAQIAALEPKVLAPFWTRYFPTEYKQEDALKALAEGRATRKDLEDQMRKRNPGVFDTPVSLDELYRSDDGGKTWRRTHRSRIGGFGGYYWGKIFINPANADDVLLAGVPLLRSRDGGKSFVEIADWNHVDHHAIHFDPRTKGKIWNGNDGGVYLSGDDGASWRHLNNLPVGQFTTIAVDMKTPYNVYGGLQDNGTMKGPSTFRIDRPTSRTWEAIGGGDGSAIAVDPRDGGDIVYIASQFGAHQAFNQKTGQRWNARAPGGRRYNWVSPLIISPHHPDIVYLASEKVHRSFEQGRKYTDLSGDLSKNLPNGNVPFSTAKDLSESPLRFGLLYVGYDDGTVKMTPDGGQEWISIPTPAPDKWVSRIVASQHDVATVYCAQSGYREDDFRAYLWKSTDYGKTWKSIVGDLPNETINVIREDPENPNILYLGTDLGVWVTFDQGETWETLHGGLPTAPVHDLVVHPGEKELVIGTHSRSVWILPLRQVTSTTDELRSKPLTIFPIEAVRLPANPAYRRIPAYELRDPDPVTFPVSFFAGKSGPATVRLLDAQGNVVASVQVDALRGYNTVTMSLVREAGKPGSLPPAKPGAKSVEEILKDPYEAERARYLAPGDYKVEVAAAGTSAKADVKISGA